MIGILYCLNGDIPLDGCPNSIDLARAETRNESRRCSTPRSRWRKFTQVEIIGGGSRLVGEVSTHAIFEVKFADSAQ
jgi:hypothetical protein